MWWPFWGIGRAWPLDRKSTRLNSSHLVISYAVFCLKKNSLGESRLLERTTGHSHEAGVSAVLRAHNLHRFEFRRAPRRLRLACVRGCFFFFNDTATTEIYTLSLHDALPIYSGRGGRHPPGRRDLALRRRGRGFRQ